MSLEMVNNQTMKAPDSAPRNTELCNKQTKSEFSWKSRPTTRCCGPAIGATQNVPTCELVKL
jgi:hypothetical protein